MKGTTSILQAIHHLNQAKLNYHSFINEHHSQLPAVKLFNQHLNKIVWIEKSLVTDPFMPDVLREAVKKEIESDVLLIDDVKQKIALVKPEIREVIDQIIDYAINDKDITVTVSLN